MRQVQYYQVNITAGPVGTKLGLFHGTYSKYWAERIVARMQLAGVTASILERTMTIREG